MDFLGIGAQKSGTSWVYSCLYEHPEICIPVKEIHFFSRSRFEKGTPWYEAHFKRCAENQKTGEFSTSYLYSEAAPQRIASLYPNVKLIAIFRHPIRRAYSQYKNALKAGEITAEVRFEQYVEKEESCLGQGYYAKQLKKYLDCFARDQILILIYEDLDKNPLKFIQSIYRFIGVSDTFVPPSLEKQINIARTPRAVWLDQVMHKLAESMRRWGLDKFVHLIKSSGITDFVRSMNSKQEQLESVEAHLSKYSPLYKVDVDELSEFIDRDMSKEWNI